MKTRVTGLLLLLLLFTLPLFASITGTVMDRDGKPVAGAKISVYAQSATPVRVRYMSEKAQRIAIATAQSDAKGAFSVDTPKEQPVVFVQVEANGFAPVGRAAERDEELGALALSKAEVKTGRITSGGKPVANALVVWSAGPTEILSTTNADGRYSVPDPAKWAAFLLVVAPDAAPFSEATTMTNGAKTLDRALVSGAPVSGTVVGMDGKTPAAKVPLFVDGWPIGTTADDGTFTITRMPRTWQTLEARLGDLAAFRSRTASGKEALRLTRAGALSGVVRDAKTQVPIAGANVNLLPAGRFTGDFAGMAVTDAKGLFTMLPVAPGQYTLAAVHPGFTVTEAAVSIAPGQRAVKNLTGARDARISGVVMDEDKRPLAAVTLRAETAEAGGMPMPMMRMARSAGVSAFSGPDGRFVTRASGEGDFTVSASRKGVPPGKAGPFTLTAGDKKTGVLITMPRGVPMTGRVTDRDGKPLSGVSVTAIAAEGAMGGNQMVMRRISVGPRGTADEDVVRTGSDGSFSMQLKPGMYDFDLRREGFAPKLVRSQNAGPDARPIEATMDPGAEISGRVTRGGVGVEGVNVTAVMSGTTVVTGPDGSFTVGELAPGSTMLSINRFEESIREMRTVNAPMRDLLIELPPGGRINGRVVDKSTKQPVTAFQAGVSNSRSAGGFVMMAPPSLRSFTSEDGTFTLENVPAGPVEVVVQAAGYTTGRTANLQMEEGKTLNDVEVTLDTGVRVSGKVTAQDGAPIAGVQVSSGGGGAGGRMMMMMDPSSTTVTDAGGEFTLEAQAPGERTFQFSHQKYTSASKTVELTGREARVDIQLSSGMRVTGVVVTESGTPVAEASVRASSGSGNMFGRSVTTDANGNFSLDSMPPGRYTFNAQKHGNADGVLRDFDISSGAPVRITMKAGATIFGRVTGLSEADLQNVTVDVRGAEGAASAGVDASGNYTIEGAPTGTVRVSAATMRNFTGRRTSAVKSLSVAQGAREQVDLEFKSDTVIRGRISRNGKPLANGQVMFFPRDVRSQTSSSVTTDEAGTYSIEGLENGEYNVQVMDLQRYSPYRTTYKVSGSGTFDIDMKVTALQGRVTDASSGEPLQNARVQLRGDSDDSPFAQGAETDSAGAFTFTSVAPGRYHATAEKEGYGSKVVDVTITESAEPLNLKLTRQAGVTLRVVDARDNRLLNASVIVSDARGAIVYNDSFRFNSASEPLKLPIEAGQYSVTVSAVGYAARTLTLSSPGTQTIGLTPGGTLLIRSKSDTRQRARLVDASGTVYYRYATRGDASFALEPRGLENTIRYIAPGTYTLQLLGNGDAVQGSASVTIVEGQVATTEI